MKVNSKGGTTTGVAVRRGDLEVTFEVATQAKVNRGVKVTVSSISVDGVSVKDK